MVDESKLLEVRNINFAYGGLQILAGLSFALGRGEKVALIGPNGAGKTTLLNIISGLLYPLSGEIYVSGREISRLPPHERASLGLGRSFQTNQLFLQLNILENVLVALKGVETSGFQIIRPLSSYHDRADKAQALLESIGLWGKKDLLPTELSHGENRLVEIALSMASEPKVLLLDEPTAGLTREEALKLAGLLTDLTKDRAVLFSAHDLDFVFEVAQRVVVLYYGNALAEGSPEDIAIDPKVKEIYLGS